MFLQSNSSGVIELIITMQFIFELLRGDDVLRPNLGLSVCHRRDPTRLCHCVQCPRVYLRIAWVISQHTCQGYSDHHQRIQQDFQKEQHWGFRNTLKEACAGHELNNADYMTCNLLTCIWTSSQVKETCYYARLFRSSFSFSFIQKCYFGNKHLL